MTKKKSPKSTNVRKWQVWVRQKEYGAIGGSSHYRPVSEHDFGSFEDAAREARKLNNASKDLRIHYYPYRTRPVDDK